MKEIINNYIAEYKESGQDSFSDSARISGFREFDLWMGVRAFEYDLNISTRTYETGFLFWKEEKTEYVVDVKIFDTYNFNSKSDAGDGIGSFLNNIAYSLHEKGVGNDYKWVLEYQTTVR